MEANCFQKGALGSKCLAGSFRIISGKASSKKPALFGCSMGGYVALRLACKFPDAKDDIFTLGTKFDWNLATAKKEAEMLNAEKMEKKTPAFAESLRKIYVPNESLLQCPLSHQLTNPNPARR